MTQFPGETYPQAWSRAYHFATTWGVAVLLTVTTANGVREEVVTAHDGRPELSARLVGQGGTVPVSPVPVDFSQHPASGATGPTGPAGPRPEPSSDGPTGPTGPAGPSRT